MRDAFYLAVNPSGHGKKDDDIICVLQSSCSTAQRTGTKFASRSPSLSCLPRLSAFLPHPTASQAALRSLGWSLSSVSAASGHSKCFLPSPHHFLWGAAMVFSSLLHAVWPLDPSLSHSVYHVPDPRWMMLRLPLLASPSSPIAMCPFSFEICFHFMYASVLSACTPCVCPVPTEARKGHQIPWGLELYR